MGRTGARRAVRGGSGPPFGLQRQRRRLGILRTRRHGGRVRQRRIYLAGWGTKFYLSHALRISYRRGTLADAGRRYRGTARGEGHHQNCHVGRARTTGRARGRRTAARPGSDPAHLDARSGAPRVGAEGGLMSLPPPPCCVPTRNRLLRLNESRRGSAGRRRVNAGSISDMVRLDGGPFLMGSESPEAFASDGEGPVREIVLDPF